MFKISRLRTLASRTLVLTIVTTGLSLCTLSQTPAPSFKNAKAATSGKLTSDRLQDRVFQSESLDRQMHYRILLPAEYSNTARSYPVLYLLHGWHGDYTNWSTLTDLTHYAERLPIIIVMPDANDSWYVDSSSNPRDQYERYIVRDLIQDVEQHWRTLRSTHRRAIAGLSMGGYGSVKFALKYPALFSFAGSISGAFNATDMALSESRADLAPSLQNAFGPAGSTTRVENNVYAAVDLAHPGSTPYLYIDCGNHDVSFLESNRKLVAELTQRDLAYEYHETPGAHTWQYWDSRLPALLSAAVRKINPEHIQ